jgi:hypothetical protein
LLASVLVSMPFETSNCNKGSAVGLSPIAGAGAAVEGGADAVVEAAVLVDGAPPLSSEAGAANGRSPRAKIPANIRCEMEIIY